MRAAISRGDVLDRALVDLRLDVARQQAVENRRGIRLVDVVPMLLQLVVGLASAAPAAAAARRGFCVMVLTNCALHQEQPIDLAFAIGVEHDLDRADQILDVRPIAQAACAAENRHAQAAEERQPLAADHAQARPRRPCPATRAPAAVRVLNTLVLRPPAQAAIGGDDDDADRLGLALDQERMLDSPDSPAFRWPIIAAHLLRRRDAPRACAPARGASCWPRPSPSPW